MGLLPGSQALLPAGLKEPALCVQPRPRLRKESLRGRGEGPSLPEVRRLGLLRSCLLGAPPEASPGHGRAYSKGTLAARWLPEQDSGVRPRLGAVSDLELCEVPGHPGGA